MASLTAYLREHDPAAIEGNDHMFDSPREAMLLFLDRPARAARLGGEVRPRRSALTADQIAAMREHLLTAVPDRGVEHAAAAGRPARCGAGDGSDDAVDPAVRVLGPAALDVDQLLAQRHR